MNTVDELLSDIFDGKKTGFYTDFEGWVKASRRFKAFAISQRSKIRTKLKSARDAEQLKDLRAELETAMLLLREEKFTLEYEKYAALRQRGPDYTVTFKTHTPFNIEVRRIRSLEFEGDSEARVSKLMAVVSEKTRQMPPSIVNFIWLFAERDIDEEELNLANITLRQLAERKVEDYFTKRGFTNAADFLKQYRQLSGIVLHQSSENLLWLNSLAKHKAPPELLNALKRLY
jgi:hypothetical protein